MRSALVRGADPVVPSELLTYTRDDYPSYVAPCIKIKIRQPHRLGRHRRRVTTGGA